GAVQVAAAGPLRIHLLDVEDRVVPLAEFNDLNDVLSKVNEKTCAIIMETVQGEGGIYPADETFLREIRKFCTEHDICLILDEIQCGMGRTGAMFAYQKYGIEPDIMTSAKALGCGVPVGCFACKEAFAAMVPGDHGSTYGGNPFVTKAVETVFGMFKDSNILQNVNETAAYLWDALEDVKKDFPNVVSGHRGLGLMQGLVLSVPVGPVVKEVIAQGCILISAGTDVIRFVPPLIAKPCHVDEMISCLRAALSKQ
ncbi:MAG: aminotransferase class III-fold pyridoxal phosphate-dependent enzyme, partial [Lachnospiraceae bacterium]|nr:aminotransferase class III-fold pyridoxal phosphate-dependent enzyme [Lachnospiraceae bacterium]